MVRLLDRPPAIPLGARCPRTLYDCHPPAQRHGHAPHGPHAQQHTAGCAGSPRAHVWQERLLGTGHGPRVDCHRSQGRSHAPRAGDREIVAHARGIPQARLGVEREVRRCHPQAAAQVRRLVRLGTHLLHDGRRPHRERPAGLLRPLRKRQDLPRRTHGQLGPLGQDGPFGRRGGFQGIARQALLPAL